MDELLTHYQDELLRVRQLCRNFAERYPRLADKLHMSSEICDDPHVERLIQASALIAARTAKRLDDDYPQFTESLLEVLFPHYLRPFPSCAIVRLDATANAGSEVVRVARGTLLESGVVNGVRCKFSTAYDMTAGPVQISAASFEPFLKAPVDAGLARGATMAIRLTLDNVARADSGRLRVFIEGEPSFCAALRDALFMRAVSVHAQTGDERWIGMPDWPIHPVGFASEEALIPFDARSHPAYRLLTEYFAFPEKFNFFDIDLASVLANLPAPSQRVVLHVALAGLRADGHAARLLQSLSAENLLLSCTPVVNLFAQPAIPIQVTQCSTDYAVLADPSHASSFEVYAIDEVKMLRQSGGHSVVAEFRPFYSLRHGEGEAAQGRYWVARRDDLTALRSPGHERRIALVDIAGDPLAIDKQTLSLDLRCTNRDLPSLLGTGNAAGDFVGVPGASGCPIRFLRKPTRTLRIESGEGAHWRLISHLSLNQRALSDQGLAGFQEMLALNDLQRSAVSQRQIGGIVGMTRGETCRWQKSRQGVSLLHGLEIRLTLDEDAFVGNSMHLFVQVIEQFFELYVQLNSFVELVVVSHKTGEELIRCVPRKGSLSPA